MSATDLGSRRAFCSMKVNNPQRASISELGDEMAARQQHEALGETIGYGQGRRHMRIAHGLPVERRRVVGAGERALSVQDVERLGACQRPGVS